jgi:hypothetical protein
MRQTFRRARSAAREQLKYIFARQPRRASDVLPSDSDFIDVNTLLTTLSVEDLNRTSEEYYRQHPDLVWYLGGSITTSDACACLARYDRASPPRSVLRSTRPLQESTGWTSIW